MHSLHEGIAQAKTGGRETKASFPQIREIDMIIESRRRIQQTEVRIKKE
jgi:hypothetical protein